MVDQVIAQYLIIIRVANQRSLTNDSIVSGNVESIRFSSQGKPMDGGETLPVSGHPMDGGEFGVRIETRIDITWTPGEL